MNVQLYEYLENDKSTPDREIFPIFSENVKNSEPFQ